MSRKYKVSFTVEGEMLGDDYTLSVNNMKLLIKRVFDEKLGSDYWRNRSIDTKVSDLKVKPV